jgi:hypothetical protein
MGGRLLDFLGQGVAADLPVAADMPARIVNNGCALYYAYDEQRLYMFNQDDVAWDSISLAMSLDAEAVQDIIGLFVVNGAGIAVNYDDGLNQLIISSSITQYTDEMAADAVGALFAAGVDSGITITYDDAGNAIALSVTPMTYAINDLTDVDTVTTPPTNGQALVWDDATDKWIPGTIEGGEPESAIISARYWRIRNTVAPAGNQIALATVKFRDANAANLSGNGASASASSVFDGSYPAASAFDASDDTRWVTGAGVGTAWLAYDFGSPVAIYDVTVMAWSGALAAGMPNVLVEYSDNGTDYTTLVTQAMAAYVALTPQTVTVQAVEVGTSSQATTADMYEGTATNKFVSPKRIFDSAIPVAVPYAAAIALNGNTGFNFSTTLTGNVTFSNPTNMKAGQSGLYIVTQDATGSRVASWGGNWRFEGGAAVGGVLSTAANAVDAISYYVRTDGTIIASVMKDIKA